MYGNNPLRYSSTATAALNKEKRETATSDAVLSDPLRASVPLPFHHVLFPYGFPLQVKANDQSVLRLAEQSWGGFPERYRDTPIELRVVISDVTSRRRAPVPMFRAQANLLTIVADSHNHAACDLATGVGFACLTRGTVAHRTFARYHFLDAMVYSMLDTQHLLAIHAACVAKDGHGVLLVGASGAGKSSLAYACMRRGWTYISDDASSLLRRRTGRVVVGNPQTIRFRPTASELFPELRGEAKLRNGKPTVEIKTESFPHNKTATECTVSHVVFLNRQACDGEAPALSPVSRDESFRRLFQEKVWPPELPIHQERLQAVERLLTAELLELTYKSLDPAVDLLERVAVGGKA